MLAPTCFVFEGEKVISVLTNQPPESCENQPWLVRLMD